MANTLIEKYIENNFFGKLVGMDFEIVNEGEVNYFLTIQQKHLATPHAAHGGVISALIDGALGVAGLSKVCNENKVVSTVEYKLNFLSPALLNDQLTAKAKVEHCGKRLLIITCDVICTNRENKLIAKAMGTFNAYDATKAGY
ncbi:MAG: PaaI family thioesterase [Bacteroidetes bacterium]|nr:PaaI family thioesterase [Bacteroidota bacterium]